MAEEKQSSEILRALYSGIREDLDRVEALLDGVVRSDNPLIREINSYLFANGGKRLRPALVTLSARLSGNGDAGETAFWSALVEIIHTASLVHDDIVDRTELRRGRETVHSRWGANVTVLLGDHLYIRAIHEALRTRRYEIIDALAEASERLIDGEILEYTVEGDTNLDENRYLEILRKKTASLFSASCRIGGLVGGAGPDLLPRLEAFGLNLGLAFQIVDDLLDYTGRPDELGKPVLTDLRDGRITLPLIYALNKADAGARANLRGWISARSSDPSAVDRVQAAVLASGALPEASAKAGEFAAAARKALSGLPDSMALQTLTRLTDFVLERSL